LKIEWTFESSSGEYTIDFSH